MANLRNRRFAINDVKGNRQYVDAAYWMVGGSVPMHAGGIPEAAGFVVFKAVNHDIVFGIREDQVMFIRDVTDAAERIS